MPDNTPISVMTIGGVDPSGGAGIAVDLKTFMAFDTFGTCAVAALTAQNTTEVRSIVPTERRFLQSQIECVLDDISVVAAKTGMLFSSENIACVADIFEQRENSETEIKLIVDPVTASSTKKILVDENAKIAYLNLLFKVAYLITPNIAEAEFFTGIEVNDIDSMKVSSKALHEMTGSKILVTGGHLTGNSMSDVYFDGTEFEIFESERIPTLNNHGTGCTLSAAITALVGSGQDIVSAIRTSKEYVSRALVRSSSWEIGKGHGPLNHRGAIIINGK